MKLWIEDDIRIYEGLDEEDKKRVVLVIDEFDGQSYYLWRDTMTKLNIFEELEIINNGHYDDEYEILMNASTNKE